MLLWPDEIDSPPSTDATPAPLPYARRAAVGLLLIAIVLALVLVAIEMTGDCVTVLEGTAGRC